MKEEQHFLKPDNVNKVDKCVGAKICFLYALLHFNFVLKKNGPKFFLVDEGFLTFPLSLSLTL